MRIYIFMSQTAENISAFGGDADGNSLPAQLGPWRFSGVIETSESPPHNLSRIRIESAIRLHGYQLWRLKHHDSNSSSHTETS